MLYFILIDISRFLSHFAAGSLYDINLPSDELNIVLKKPNEPAVLIQKEKVMCRQEYISSFVFFS